jgi:hypothetical protein
MGHGFPAQLPPVRRMSAWLRLRLGGFSLWWADLLDALLCCQGCPEPGKGLRRSYSRFLAVRRSCLLRRLGLQPFGEAFAQRCGDVPV